MTGIEEVGHVLPEGSVWIVAVWLSLFTGWLAAGYIARARQRKRDREFEYVISTYVRDEDSQ